MKKTVDEYRNAALAHINAARAIRESPDEHLRSFVSSNYLAGLAVECMLRAYAMRAEVPFSESHSIRYWYGVAKFHNIGGTAERENVRSAVNVLFTHWLSEQRYWGEEFLLAHFKKAHLDRDVKGSNPLKELTRQTYDAAYEVVQIGVAGWKTWKPQ
jgi:hypothetical protein